MKRSTRIRLILLGGLSTTGLGGCDQAPTGEPRISPGSVYTNNYFVPGAGYYHAPFHAFYPQPYNFYDASRKLYFAGGTWSYEPHRSVINLSSPTDTAASAAEAARESIQRGGFGSSSGSHHVYS